MTFMKEEEKLQLKMLLMFHFSFLNNTYLQKNLLFIENIHKGMTM